ncbi:hypothetical protein PoB_000099900 [Plakobranchus ocellatus]|uniref:Uncharacterized protein n=1 Tax=Plakobranchus ocellatus TaxID=259542 RepID=A0AAV3XX47_9GAST|nr:hypothetical protein PoB_000099900 [Plakobranchus ocellatus]
MPVSYNLALPLGQEKTGRSYEGRSEIFFFIRKRRQLKNKKSGAEAKAIFKGPFYDQMLLLSDYIREKSNLVENDTESLVEEDMALECDSVQLVGSVETATPASTLSRSVTPTATLQESEEQGVGACADPPIALPPQPLGMRVSPIEPQQRNSKKELRRSFRERNDLIDSTLHEMSARSEVLFDSLQKNILG